MKKLLLLSLLSLAIACNEDDNDTTLCIPPNPVFEFTLRDVNQNPLLGTVFVQDSFKLSNNRSTVYLKPTPQGDEENLQVIMPDIISGVDYTLELSDTENDIVRISYEIVTESCGAHRLTSFVYNGQTIYTFDSQVPRPQPIVVIK